MKRIRTVFTGVAGAPYYNNLYFTNGPTAQDALDLVEAFWNDCSAVMTTECVWAQEDTVAVVDPTTGVIDSFDSGTGASGAGDLSQELLPLQTQALITWKTLLVPAGRRLQGRTFVPGLGEGDNDQGFLSSAAATLLGTAADNLIDNSGGNFIIWSRTNGVTAVASSATIGSKFAVLRSRRD